MKQIVALISALIIAPMFFSCGENKGTKENISQIADDTLIAVEEEIVSVAEDEIKPSKESEEESVRKFVTDMYAVVLPAVARGNGDRYISRYCDENFAGWVKHIEEYDRENYPGEIGCFDCEFWTRSQDPDLNIKPTIKSVNFFIDYNDDEYVDMKVSLKGEYYPAKEVYLRLFHFEEGWKITDYDGMLMDMKSYLSTQ